MRLEDLMAPIPLLKLQDADPAVAAGAREQAPALVGRPGDNVHRGRVQGEVGDARPLGVGFAPYQDFAVVGGGGEDGAVFGVGLEVGEG